MIRGKQLQYTFSTLLTAALGLLMVFASTVLSGCSCSRNNDFNIPVEVASYEDIKDSLKDIPNMLYFDVSRYDVPEALFFYLSNTPVSEGDFGYYCVTSEAPHDSSSFHVSLDLQKTEADTIYTMLDVTCRGIYEYGDSDNRVSKEPNSEYRGVPTTVGISDHKLVYSGSDSLKNELSSYYDYPDNSYVFFADLIFTLGHYEYLIRGGYVITPDEISQGLTDQINERAKRELESLADSIIDQYEEGAGK